MKIAKDAVVSFEYTLTDPEGEVLDSSEDGPMVYLHGHDQIVKGLEKELTGKQAGDALKVTVSPEEGYGEVGGGAPMNVPLSELPPDLEPEEGMGLNAVGKNGEEVTLWIREVKKDSVMLSLDHPLAGVTLHFDVKIKDVRKATKDELHHGHAHGPDGHHHH